MKLAIFGATGTVGSALLAQALDAGYEVRVLARTPSKVARTDGSLTVLRGDANDPDAARRTITGCLAVLTALGGFSDADSIRIGTGNIIAALQDGGIRRLVVMQGFHLEFPGDPDNFGRKVILPLLVLGSRSLLPDSRAMASAVQASDLDWTVVRAPRVVVGDRTGNYRTGRRELGPLEQRHEWRRCRAHAVLPRRPGNDPHRTDARPGHRAVGEPNRADGQSCELVGWRRTPVWATAHIGLSRAQRASGGTLSGARVSETSLSRPRPDRLSPRSAS